MTAEVDSETRKYLHELDSFGRPPEIFDIHSEAAVFANSKPPTHENRHFRQKLHQINVRHQKRISDELDSVKTVSTETRQPRTYRTEMLKLGEKAEIKKDEVENLRQSVLKANRPLNPWVDAQRLSPSPRSGSLFVDPPSPKTSKVFINAADNRKPKPIQETVSRGIRLSDEVDAKSLGNLTSSFEKLGNPSRIIGKCGKCYETVFDNNQVTYAMDSIFHEQCLTCSICKQPLRNKKFYRSDGKNYCEEDYFLNNPAEKMIRCAVCEGQIADMVLQALGKSYHPRCFRCCHCGQCLDGVPFAVDGNNRVFCMEDYQNLFSPNCAVCHKPIRASNDFGQIVRVVAMEKEFHIDCYRCEGCGLQLTNERDKQCYPLDDHLLCRRCNIEWSKMGDLPITDC
uniref:LIM zinc-binding domain-containing protein n=1 Tax=Panagrolaimus sp. JU765 TaxID=591449 RepID=A0AC34QRJ8_9BILA